MRREAFRGWYLVGHIVILAVAALFVRLGIWQLDRWDEARERNAIVGSRMAQPAAPLDRVLPAGARTLDEAAYRPVTATGSYRTGDEVRVVLRSFRGSPGDYLLTPLVTADGRAILVNRGWVPRPAELPVEAPPPEEEVTVTGILLPPEVPGRRVGEGEAGVAVTRVDVELVQAALGYDLAPGFVQLTDQAPAQPGSLPATLPPPELDDGPHLSYAVQWFLFAVIVLIGWPILVVRSPRSPRHAGRYSMDSVRPGIQTRSSP